MQHTIESQPSGEVELALTSLGLPDGQATANDQVVLACEDNLAFMGRLPDDQMKLVVTSPPYNLGKDYEAKTTFDSYIELQEARNQRVRSGSPPSGVHLLAGRKLRR